MLLGIVYLHLYVSFILVKREGISIKPKKVPSINEKISSKIVFQ